MYKGPVFWENTLTNANILHKGKGVKFFNCIMTQARGALFSWKSSLFDLGTDEKERTFPV